MNDLLSVAAAIRVLAPLVGAWGNRNFKYHAPYIGAAEEAGELLHAKLKLAQGIRGSAEEHRAKIVDAYADLTVFLAHLQFKLLTKEQMDDFPHRVEYGHLLMCLGRLLVDPTDEKNLRAVVAQLVLCANCDDVDVVKELREVWVNVSQRDWVKYPKNGMTE